MRQLALARLQTQTGPGWRRFVRQVTSACWSKKLLEGTAGSPYPSLFETSFIAAFQSG